MTRRDKINKLLKNYDVTQQDKIDFNLQLQRRLQALSQEFGVDDTALAAGLKISSLMNYIKAKTPLNISEKTVLQAEEILSQVR